MSLDSKERFSVTAGDYEKFRPGYPQSLLDWIEKTTGKQAGARVVDLGSGTGISSRLFAARGYEVTGVEPNDAMRAKAEAVPEPQVRYVKGEATATTLETASQDLAIAAQAFHWFDVPRTITELARILRADGWCVAFWNVRASTPFLDAYRALLEELGEYNSAPKPEHAIARIEAEPRVKDLRAGELSNTQQLDLAGLIGRAFSSSYVVHAKKPRAEIEAALREIFRRFEQNGVVEMSYRVVIRALRING